MFSQTIGRGKPTVILHGFGLDHRVMLGCLEPIFKKKKGFQRLYLDLPGMGKTKETFGVKTSSGIFRLVMSFISKTIPRQKFLLIGYSYGAYLARHIAARKPNLVDGMLLICPVIVADPSKRTLPRHKALIRRYRPTSFKTEEDKEIFDVLVVQTKAVWGRVKKFLLPGYHARNKQFLEKIFERAYSIPPDIPRFKKSFRKKVSIICGRGDSVVGFIDAAKHFANYPKGTITIIDNAGHNLPFEQPRQFRRAIEKWLETVTCSEESASLPR